MMRNTIELVDVEVRTQMANRMVRESNSFEIPSRAEREDLWPGDLVKLISTNAGEYLWVKVLNRDGTDPGTGKLYSGTVISNPHEGDKVSFGPENVTDIAHVTLRKTREKQLHSPHNSRGKRHRHAPETND